jgi:hypothetical protein
VIARSARSGEASGTDKEANPYSLGCSKRKSGSCGECDMRILGWLAGWASNNCAPGIGRAVQAYCCFIERIFYNERSATLNNLIGKLHATSLHS